LGGQITPNNKLVILGHYLHPQSLFDSPGYILNAISVNKDIMNYLLDLDFPFKQLPFETPSPVLSLSMSEFNYSEA